MHWGMTVIATNIYHEQHTGKRSNAASHSSLDLSRIYYYGYRTKSQVYSLQGQEKTGENQVSC